MRPIRGEEMNISGDIIKRITQSFTLLAVVSALTACGSLASKHQVVSVDSHPRGVKVGTADGQLVGRTPLFIKINRDYVFRLKTNVGGLQRFSCPYRWLASPLENSALMLPGSAGGLPGALGAWTFGMVYDLVSGAAFWCPSHIKVKANGTPLEEQKYCPDYLVMTPNGASSMVEKELEAYWMDYAKRGHSCARQVDRDVGLTWLRRLKMTGGPGTSLKDDAEKIAFLGYKTGATHTVQFRLDDELMEDAQMVWADVTDLHALKRRPPVQLYLPIDTETAAENRSSLAAGFLRRSLRLLPETLTLGVTSRNIVWSPRGDGDEMNAVDGDFDAAPTVRFLSVSHPDAFGSWAWDLSLGTGIGLNLLSDISADEPNAPEVSFGRGVLHVLGSLTAHTPIGAYTLALGGGPAYYYLNGAVFSEPHQFGGEMLVSWYYTAFLGDHVMFRFFAELINPSGNIWDGRLDNIIEIGAVWGYYFDGIDTWTKGLF